MSRTCRDPLRLLAHGLRLGLALLLGGAAAALAQPQPQPEALAALLEPRFESVGDASQIPDGVVTALAQDRHGRIWVGSSAGLLSYDGYQLRRRRLQQPGEPHGGTSFVRSLLAARDGSIWVGSDSAGLVRYDPDADQWAMYPSAAREGAGSGSTVRALAEDREGGIWVGTLGGGLERLDPVQRRFIHFGPDQGLPDVRVQVLLTDRRGDLWVGTWNGLARCRPAAGRCEPVFAGAEGLAGEVVTLLGEAPDGSIWVGTRGGDLARVEPGSGAARWLDRGDGTRAAYYAMVAGREGVIWLGRTAGIERRALSDGRLLQLLRRDYRKPWGLAGNSIATLLRDGAGWLWVGSFGGGLQRYNANDNGLQVLRLLEPEPGHALEADVRSVAQLRNGEIWLGLNEQGIVVLDRRLHGLAHIAPAQAGTAGRAGFGGLIGAIAESAQGQVWVGSDARLYQFDARRHLLAVQAVGKGRIRRLLPAGAGLWIGTEDGLFRREPGGLIRRLTLAEGRALGGNIHTLLETPDGTLWVGSDFGLFRVARGSLELREVGSPAGRALGRGSVLGLHLDGQGRIWVDTNAGLHRAGDWSGAEVAFEPVAQQRGFGGQSFGANLLGDAQDRVWSQRGVFDPSSASGGFYALTPADGSDIGTGWFRSYAALDDGRLLFGGSAGLLVVQPQRFKPWTYAPPLLFTELRIEGERVPRGEPDQPLLLQPGQRGFSAQFAALDFTSPLTNRYRFRLEGLDEAWTAVDASYRTASFRALAPGDYRLRVQGSNRAGVWSDQELSLPVRVLPAWWQTWWGGLLGLALLGGVIWIVVQLRTRYLQHRQRVLEASVRERTEALEAVSAALERKSRELEEASLSDPLTGMRNRRFLARHIDGDVSLALRHRQAQQRVGVDQPEDGDLLFFLLDLDHFKQLNDRHGHAGGDAVLQQMRARLQPVFRDTDYLLRWGGEEFLIVARATSRRHAAELAERARAMVAGEPFALPDGGALQASCSVGFACFPLSAGHPEAVGWGAVLGLADAALYAAKRAGRNTWVGVLGAGAMDEAALRERAAGSGGDWFYSGELELVRPSAAAARVRVKL